MDPHVTVRLAVQCSLYSALQVVNFIFPKFLLGTGNTLERDKERLSYFSHSSEEITGNP